MMVNDYIQALEETFLANANADLAKQQEDYLKGHFKCFGIKTPLRREIQKPFLDKDHLPTKADAMAIITECWSRPQREFHYFGQELTKKYIKKFTAEEVKFLEFLVTQNSWWDTVDFIATHLVGTWIKNHIHLQEQKVKEWCSSDDMWLKRTAIIHQLKYGKELNEAVLTYAIEQNLNSKEFFINKAIGWALRQHTRANPDWVIQFVEDHPELSNLSKKEALRLIQD